MKLAIANRISEEDYLAGEKIASVKHEYVAGEVFAMAGASKMHATIAGNIFSALRAHLRGKPCRAYISDMKVRVKASSAYYYPDVAVTCSPRDLAVDAPAYYLEAPCLIAEVLSDSTERIDRREKLLAYQQMESLNDYLLINQDKREAEHYRRTAEGWQRDILGPDDTLVLPSLGLELSVDRIYEDSGIA
ncbi:MAG: Uma2 family endonuclease [Sulfuritalea sp.]|nr:Uma2 family endonuclease [Sulfuritalea sp.]